MSKSETETETESRPEIDEPVLSPDPAELAPDPEPADDQVALTARPAFAPVRGLISGIVGTGVMTAGQLCYQRAAGSPSSTTPAEGVDFVLRRLGRGGLTRKQRRSPTVTNLVHLAYGTGWGFVYSALAAKRPFSGVGFGAGVWAFGLGMMPAVGVSKAPWKQDPRSLATELSFHLLYGAAVATTDRALRGEPADPQATVAPIGLGVAAGMRTFTPPAVTALRSGAPAGLKAALVAAALGELGWWDKHPSTPGRTELQGMVGRAGGGAGAAASVAGFEGALIGGSSAIASGVALEELRGRLVERFDVPDPALGVVEDAIAIALSFACARTPGG